MAVVNGLHDLSPEELRLKLWHLTIWLHLQVPMKAATIHVLHDQEDLLVRLEDLVELCNVDMIQLLHDLHLSFHTLASVRLHQLELLVNLHSYLLVEHLV